MKNKEKIKYVFLGLTLLLIFFLPKEASAGFWSVFGEATIGTIFSSLGLVFVGLMAGILKIAGDIFDLAIGLTLLNSGINNIEAIKIGWRIIRDISNLFLIFALVFIAIATILQIESYGAKKLILPLILVALLINFSLAVTKFIIDISNILALQFYYAVDVQTSGPDGTTGAANPKYKSLSSVFMAGTNLQSVYEYDFKDPVADDRTSGSEFSSEVRPTEEITNWEIGKAQWLGGILFAIAAFVLFAGAILFIIRQVSLLILMVLSPLAFVFGIFPGTKKHGEKWWNTLFSQAFFAPAYLFMFYLVAKIAQDSSFLTYIGLGTKYGEKSASLGQYLAGQAAAKATPEGGYLINFLIMAALMIGALWVAKQMGAIGADMTWKWGGSLRKGLVGSVTKEGKLKGGLIPRFGGRITRRAAGRVLAPEALLGRQLRKVPWVKRGVAEITAKNKARIEQIQAGYKKFSTSKELKNLLPRYISMPFNRASVIKELAERGDLKEEYGLTTGDIQKGMKTMRYAGMDLKDVEKWRADLVERFDEKGEHKLKEERETRLNIFKGHSPDDVKKQSVEVFAGNRPENTFARQDAYATYNKAKFEAMHERRDEASDAFYKGLKDLGNTAEEIADKLEQMGNKAAADFIKSKEGIEILNQYDSTLPSRLLPHLAIDDDQLKNLAKGVKSKDIADLKLDELQKDTAKYQTYLNEVIKSFSPGHLQKLIEKGDQFYDDVIDKLKNEAGGSDVAEDIANAIYDAKTNTGNKVLANWIRSGPGREALGFKATPPPEPPPRQPAGFMPQGYQAGGGQTAAPPAGSKTKTGSVPPTAPRMPGTTKSGGPPGYQGP